MNNRNWNIRGLNASDKHDVVRNKIEESGCSIICLQETKIQSFDLPLIRKFAPKRFDKFDSFLLMGLQGAFSLFGIVPSFLASQLINSPSD